MKTIGRTYAKPVSCTICRSFTKPFHPPKFGRIAGAVWKCASGFPLRYGAILKDTNSIMRSDTELSELNDALDAALDKKALDLVVIDVAEVCSFADNFIICTRTSNRHSQTIADGIEEHLRKLGVRTLHIEGRTEGEWILMDYFDFVIHIFTARAREFYDLERLWRAGRRRDVNEFIGQRT